RIAKARRLLWDDERAVLGEFARDVHHVQFKLGAAIARRVARAFDAPKWRIGDRHVIATKVQGSPVENIGIDPARLEQQFAPDFEIARVYFDACQFGDSLAP